MAYLENVLLRLFSNCSLAREKGIYSAFHEFMVAHGENGDYVFSLTLSNFFSGEGKLISFEFHGARRK